MILVDLYEKIIIAFILLIMEVVPFYFVELRVNLFQRMIFEYPVSFIAKNKAVRKDDIR